MRKKILLLTLTAFISTDLYISPVFATEAAIPAEAEIVTTETETAESESIELPEENLEPGTDTLSLSEEEEADIAKQAEAAEAEIQGQQEEQYADLYDSMTQEQKDTGYTVVDGRIVSPEELSRMGNPDEVTYGGVMPGEHTGYIRFEASVPDDVHGEVYIEVINLNTYALYGAKMYEANNYATSLCLPAGKYGVSSGGLTQDVTGNYGVYNQYFTVKSGTNAIVHFTVRDYVYEHEQIVKAEQDASVATTADDESSKTTNVGKENASVSGSSEQPVNTQAQPTAPAKVEKNTKKQVVGIVLSTLLFTGVPLLFIILYIKKTRGKTRGFED